jgi:predicted ATPase
MFDGPALDKIRFDLDNADITKYPYSLPIIQNLKEITFPSQVTFLVGENGSGNSTILETIATLAGFGSEGGSKNISFNTSEEKFANEIREYSRHATASWRKKPMDGYFFRAETFFAVANYLDTLVRDLPGQTGSTYGPYGGKSLHQQSHGEGFLSFFNNRVGKGGFFIFDEPEAALSPQRQLSLLAIIHNLCKDLNTQFIIASHSPILLAYPEATIYSCDSTEIQTIEYKETKHYEITKGFLDNPNQYLKHLFAE